VVPEADRAVVPEADRAVDPVADRAVVQVVVRVVGPVVAPVALEARAVPRAVSARDPAIACRAGPSCWQIWVDAS